MPFPGQSSPPCFGAGFVHVLSLRVVPIPQDVEHCVHDDQWVQDPSTEISKNWLHLIWYFSSKELSFHICILLFPNIIPTSERERERERDREIE